MTSARRSGWLSLVLCCVGLASLASAEPGAAPAASVALPAATAGSAGNALARGPVAPLAQHGVVSVSQPDAAAAGAQVLVAGGDAIDAALAIQCALNVTEPESSGLGGGAMLLVWRADEQRAWFIDGRETAPAAASADQFAQLDFEHASTTGLAVGVPGTLAAFQLAQRRWGRRSFAEDLAPAIRLADEGFVLRPYVARMLADPVLQARLDPTARAVFLPADRSPAAGERLVQRDLARLLRRIAEDPASFYQGEIAAAIVRAQRGSRAGAEGAGRMQLTDLAAYRARLRAPLEGRYRDYTVLTAQPPSAGGVTLLETLGMLEATPLGSTAAGFGPNAPATWHRVIEALRLASADRLRWLGDDAQTTLPVAGLLDPAYLKGRAAGIGARAAPDDPVPGEPEKGRNTTHFSVVDSDGNIALVTSTIEYAWGSGIMVPGWGLLLNNQLTDFNLRPAPGAVAGQPGANDPAPGRRPRSSMTPTLLLRDGRPVAGFGSPGSATIISTVLQMVLRVVDFGESLPQAVEAPRFALSTARDEAAFEPGWAPDLLAGLRALGHSTRELPRSLGSVQAVGLPIDAASGPEGAADSRRDGTVVKVSR